MSLPIEVISGRFAEIAVVSPLNFYAPNTPSYFQLISLPRKAIYPRCKRCKMLENFFCQYFARNLRKLPEPVTLQRPAAFLSSSRKLVGRQKVSRHTRPLLWISFEQEPLLPQKVCYKLLGWIVPLILPGLSIITPLLYYLFDGPL